MGPGVQAAGRLAAMRNPTSREATGGSTVPTATIQAGLGKPTTLAMHARAFSTAKPMPKRRQVGAVRDLVKAPWMMHALPGPTTAPRTHASTMLAKAPKGMVGSAASTASRPEGSPACNLSSAASISAEGGNMAWPNASTRDTVSPMHDMPTSAARTARRMRMGASMGVPLPCRKRAGVMGRCPTPCTRW